MNQINNFKTFSLGTINSDPFEFLKPHITVSMASFIEILNLVIAGWVRGKGFLFLLIFRKKGITEPLLANTFPYLTTEKIVSFFSGTKLFEDINNLSEHSFVAPYKLIGEQALSVDKAITFFTLFCIAASITFWAPTIFVLINSKGLYSAVSTCFKAAA